MCTKSRLLTGWISGFQKVLGKMLLSTVQNGFQSSGNLTVQWKIALAGLSIVDHFMVEKSPLFEINLITTKVPPKLCISGMFYSS